MISGNLLIRQLEDENDFVVVMGVIESHKPLSIDDNSFFKGTLTRHFSGSPLFQLVGADIESKSKTAQMVVDGSKSADQLLSMPIWKRSSRCSSEYSMRGKLLVRKSQSFAGEGCERYIFFGLWRSEGVPTVHSHVAYSFHGASLQELMLDTRMLPISISEFSTSQLFMQPIWGSRAPYALNTDLSLPVYYEYQGAIAAMLKTGEWPIVTLQTEPLLQPLKKSPELLKEMKFLAAVGFGPEVHRHLLPTESIQRMHSYRQFASSFVVAS